MTESAFVYAPRAPHPDSLANPWLTICSADGTLLAHYCTRHRCGGVYDLQLHAWTLYTPMTAEEFIGALPSIGVKVSDTAALQVWIDAITAALAQQQIGRH
jgi:hypothetical protein